VEYGKHWLCGIQTWCECECDPESIFELPEGDEIEREETRFDHDEEAQEKTRPRPFREPGGEFGEEKGEVRAATGLLVVQDDIERLLNIIKCRRPQRPR